MIEKFFSDNGGNYHPIVLIPLIMWIVAQTLKFIIYSSKHGIDWKYLFEYGHMPSAHSSTMCSLIFAAGYYEGIYSPLFAITATMALIVMFDAIKLRGYVGEYGKALNKLLKKEEKPHIKLKERVGHTYLEVMSGALLGIFGAYVLIQIFNRLT